MEIKPGDHIKAFLKNGPFAGREASPFAGREFEEVTEVLPDGGYPSHPGRVNTEFSGYRLDQWEIVKVK